MVGIHALSIAKFGRRSSCLRSGLIDPEGLVQPTAGEAEAKPKRRLLEPTRGRGAFSSSGPSPHRRRSCAQGFATSLAFGDVFERPGCPHKTADTRLALTTDR